MWISASASVALGCNGSAANRGMTGLPGWSTRSVWPGPDSVDHVVICGIAGWWWPAGGGFGVAAGGRTVPRAGWRSGGMGARPAGAAVGGAAGAAVGAAAVAWRTVSSESGAPT